MKNIIIIFLSLFLISCGVSKKVSKTDTHLDVKTEVQKNDSTQVQITREDLINSIVEKLDLSKTKITFYNPPDSAGKQSINRTIETENNIKTTICEDEKSKQKTIIITGSKLVAKQQTNLDQQSKTVEKKNEIPYKLYLIITVIFIASVYCFLKWVRQ